MVRSRIPKVLITAGAILVFFVLAGATYQGVATAVERRQFPHPGRLVDVGGHQLHLSCGGEGLPTVVLEAAGTGMSSAWAWVQADLERATRVCSYDRAGLGWSEAGDRGYDPAAVPESLNALLTRAGERGPYVMVGQGLGAPLATLFASRFPADVLGLVLIDPPAAAREAARANAKARMVNVSPWLARTGLLRASRMLSRQAAGLPEPAAGALAAFLNRPDHLTRSARELARWDETVALAAQAPLDGGLDVARIEAAGGDPVALLTDREQATTATSTILAVIARHPN